MSDAGTCWRWGRLSGRRWPSWLSRAPQLVAEELVAVRDPLASWLVPGASSPPGAVAAALVRALLPVEAEDPPPPWLRGDQHLSFARAVAALRRYRGALLADQVGSGKSYIGLAAVAALEPDRAIHVLAPAALLPQWRRVAARTGLAVRLHSHELLSRGRLPPPEPGPLVLDESHRFRNPATRRYAALAPWCVGRRGLLLSATPVVNRLADLSRQLLLLVRDDALAWAGLGSLRAVEGAAQPAILAELVVTGEDRSARLPGTAQRELRIPESPEAERLRGGITALRLSRDPAIAALLRGGLLLALASSPPALAEALGRYRALLLHARDAGAAGKYLTRHAIRRVVGREPAQLVLWPLVAEAPPPVELVPDDLPLVARLEAQARELGGQPDLKLRHVGRALAERKATLLFATATATVSYLRRALGPGAAWCTGASSGIDRLPAGREEVLDWFRRPALPQEQGGRAPWLLATTDVSAEGLDLPRVQRVVHYDLPWTAVRLEQRSGRALRLGSREREVEILRVLPPPALEAALRQQAILAGKARLPERLGLGRGPEAPWRASARLAAEWATVEPRHGTALVRGTRPALLAGFRVGLADGTIYHLVRARVGRRATGDLGTLAELLALTREDPQGGTPSACGLRAALRQAAGLLRPALRALEGAPLVARALGRWPRLHARLLELAREAARQRDAARLAALQRALARLGRGTTAGEALLLQRAARRPADELLAALAALPAEQRSPRVCRVELCGLLLVEARRPKH